MLLWKKLQLSMSSPEARLKALQEIAASGDPGAVDVLLEALRDVDHAVVFAAVRALAKRNDSRAVPALLGLLKHQEEFLRGAASEALGKMGGTAVKPLVMLLQDPDHKVRELAATTLGLIGAPALGPLAALLRSPDRRQRHAIAESLGRIDDARSVELLLGAVRDRDGAVQERVFRSLVQLGKTSVPGLLQLLKDPNADLRDRALAALQKLGAEPMTETYVRPVAHGKWKDMASVQAPALDALLEVLHDPDREKRATAVLTLANIGDSRAVPGLITALVDEDRDIRDTATKALVKIGRGAVADLVAALREAPPELRLKAAVVLGYVPTPMARDPLIHALTDDDAGVRGAAAEALASYKDAPVVDPLFPLLNDPSAQVRFSAAGTLWKSRDRRVPAALLPLLRDPDAATRKRAAQGLGDLGGEECIGPLLALFDADREARLEAALAVAKINPPRGVKPLLKVATGDVLEAAEAVAILTDVLEVAAAKVATEDLLAIADLPRALEAARKEAPRAGIRVEPLDTADLLRRTSQELTRRGKAPRPSGSFAAKPAEKRVFPRRKVNNAPMHILSAMHQSAPHQAWVFDISSRGVGMMASREFTAGSSVTLRHARADDEVPWLVAEVRHCVRTDGGWKVGCKFLRIASENVLAMFT